MAEYAEAHLADLAGQHDVEYWMNFAQIAENDSFLAPGLNARDFSSIAIDQFSNDIRQIIDTGALKTAKGFNRCRIT